MYSDSQIQAIAARTRCCASSLGVKLLRNKAKGKECDEAEINVKYLLRAQRVLKCYPPATFTRAGSPAVVVINLTLSYTQPIINASIKIGGATVITLPGPFTTNENMIDAFVAASGSMIVTKLSPNSFSVTTPNTAAYNGASVTFTYLTKTPGLIVINTNFNNAGAATVTVPQSRCLDEDEVNNIIQNISEVCGPLCGCNNYLSDTENPATNNTVITFFNPAGTIEQRFRFYTTLAVVSYNMAAIAPQFDWNNIVIDALDFGNSPLTSDQYTLIGTVLKFNFDPTLVNQGTEVNMEMHSI